MNYNFSSADWNGFLNFVDISPIFLLSHLRLNLLHLQINPTLGWKFEVGNVKCGGFSTFDIPICCTSCDEYFRCINKHTHIKSSKGKFPNNDNKIELKSQSKRNSENQLLNLVTFGHVVSHCETITPIIYW